jgi:hypothetical protein
MRNNGEKFPIWTRKNNDSLDDNEIYKEGRARIEVANQKLFAAMNVIGEKNLRAFSIQSQ